MTHAGNLPRPLAAFVILATLTACAQPVDRASFRSYDLAVTHPAPYATYVSIAPGSTGARLPRLRELNSRAFNRYLMAEIGCSVDPHFDTHVVGDPRVPAGYMVPISCMPR